MSGIMGGGSGASDRAARLSQQQAAAAQRRQLAELARQQAEVDQAKSAGGGTRGRRLLTFVNQPTLGGAAEGAATLGGAG